MEKESVIVLDFGGQYNQLIARRVRECNVYCEVKPYTMSLEEIKKINPKGIILLVVQTAFMMKSHHIMTKPFLNWVFRFLVFAMVHS